MYKKELVLFTYPKEVVYGLISENKKVCDPQMKGGIESANSYL